MYLEHFQLERQPFSEHAAVAALWQDGRMAEGLARLEYLAGHGVLGLVTGPTGVGKAGLLQFDVNPGLRLAGLPQHARQELAMLPFDSGQNILRRLERLKTSSVCRQPVQVVQDRFDAGSIGPLR